MADLEIGANSWAFFPTFSKWSLQSPPPHVQLPESLSPEKIAKAFSAAGVNRVEVITEQNAGIFALCSEVVWHLVSSETEHRIVITSANLSDWGSGERSQSVQLCRAGRNLRYFCLSAEQLGTSQA